MQTEIMKEAAKYIDHLQDSLVCHIRTHGYPEKMKRSVDGGRGGKKPGDSGQDIKNVVESYIVKTSQSWTTTAK